VLGMAENAKSAVKAMARHIEAICAFHGIRMKSHRSGLADQDLREIHIRPVRSEVTYAIALHEIGHLLGPWQRSVSLLEEAGAWYWARKNALQWTPRMEKTLVASLKSYVVWFAARDEVPAPKPGHPSWKMLKLAGIRPPRRRKSAVAKASPKPRGRRK